MVDYFYCFLLSLINHYIFFHPIHVELNSLNLILLQLYPIPEDLKHFYIY